MTPAAERVEAMRQAWPEFWFDVARLFATRATCPRASIGAVLVRGKHAVGMGFNGNAPGEAHCPDDAEHQALAHCETAVHAERNALMNAWAPVFGATLYVVGPRPVCPDCRDALALCGVADIRHREA